MDKEYRILLVAPSEEAELHLLKCIEAAGYHVETSTDCLSAMGRVKSGAVDLVLLRDGVQGFCKADICHILKSLTPGKFLPVILLSSSNENDQKYLSGQGAGADDWMILPIQPGELCARVRALMRTKVLQDQLTESRNELQRSLSREQVLLKQLREDNRELKVRSNTDGLTRLYNYRYFMEWFRTEFKISRRYGHRLSLFIADIDRFKRINDTCGHPFGDYVLKEIAGMLKNQMRDADFVARYAGDEFAIALPRTGRTEAMKLAERILNACRTHSFVYRDAPISVSMSLGCATYPDDVEVTSPEMLVYLADQALYRAKRQGRDNVCVWSSLNVRSRLAILRRLNAPHRQTVLSKDPKSLLDAQLAADGISTGTFLKDDS